MQLSLFVMYYNQTCTIFVERPRVVFQEVVLSRTFYFDQLGVKGTTITLKKISNTVMYIQNTSIIFILI